MQTNSTILLSTAYLPPIKYFALLAQHSSSIVEVKESYPKQTYRNRCAVLGANGKLNLSIPVKKINGNNSKTEEIEIINTSNWYLNHWRTITSAYSNSPYFLYYKDDLEKYFHGDFSNLIKLNTAITKELLTIIGINHEIKFSDEFKTPGNNKLDFRYSISPKINTSNNEFDKYIQVFSNKFGFMANLSIIDLLFNLGPDTHSYLKNLPTN